LLHLIVGSIVFAIGVALYNGAVIIHDGKNEIFLGGQYLDITYEIGPALFLSAMPIMSSAGWCIISAFVTGRKTQPRGGAATPHTPCEVMTGEKR
jgi:hypothetical protein